MLEIRHEYNGFDLDDNDQSNLNGLIEAAGQYPEIGWIYELDYITVKATQIYFGYGIHGPYCLISFEEV